MRPAAFTRFQPLSFTPRNETDAVLSDLEQLRFSYEEDLLRRIAATLGSVPLLGYHEGRSLLDARRRSLLGDAVRVTSDLLPEIHALFQECLSAVGGNVSGELFVQQSSVYNANVFAQADAFDLLLHSAMIKEFSCEELSFVIGHELGHVIFEHSQLPVHDILSNVQGLPRASADLLLRWSRAAEVSADRVGMLCCGSLTAAVTALFKTSSGLSGIETDRILRSFRRQYERLEEHIRTVANPSGWVRTHPMMPIRFKALELAALDIIALRRRSRGFSWKGFRTIDRQIAFTLEGLETAV